MLKRALATALILISQTSWSLGTFEDSSLQREIEEFNFYSYGPATFATVCNGEECRSAHAGHMNIDKKTKVSADKLIKVGSNSKYITAILILRMVELGYFSLDDKLIDFFPEYSQWEGVTIRNLLRHTSGVPPYIFSQRGVVKGILSILNWRTRVWKPHEIIDSVAHLPSEFPAGTKMVYNNTNYILLGMIAEKASRTSMEALLDRELFYPLGMKNSYLTILDSERHRLVDGYFPANLPLPSWFLNLLSRKVEFKGPYIETTKSYDPSFPWASGSIVSTTSDLAKLTRALFAGKIIREDTLAEMKTTIWGTTLGFPLEYGLGLMKTPTQHGDAFGHGGLAPGYQALSNYIEKHDLSLVLAQNMGPGQTYSIFHNLLDQVVQGFKGTTLKINKETLPETLAHNSIHLRLKGQLTEEKIGFELNPKTVGYSTVKGNRWSRNNSYPYATFQVQLKTIEGEEFVVLRASGGDFLFASEVEVGKSIPFFEVYLKNFDLTKLNEGIDQLSDHEILAYQGTRTLEEDGYKICIQRTIDEDREFNLQLGSNGKAILKTGENLKAIANIPLRKGKSDDLNQQIYGSSVNICK